METADPSPKVRSILASPAQTLAIGEKLIDLDKAKRCDYNDPLIQDIQRGIQKIARTVLTGIQQLDSRFEGDLFGIGSFYDGLKVGVVDEFDVMLQLKALGCRDDLIFLKSEPGFSHVMVSSDTAQRWPTTTLCLKHNRVAIKDSGLPCRRTCFNTVQVLDASAVQERFRHLSDRVLKDMILPDKWEHGGFNRPAFGGFRKHGPATLYQFVWTSPDHSKEIKVNLDLTMSIKIPTPTETKPFQFDFHKRFESTNWAVAELGAMIDSDPGLSIIPLYSNFLIATGKGDKKDSWKISCSRIEQKFLGTFSNNSLLKTLIRTLKVIRDDHLTYYRRKTERQKCRHKKMSSKRNASTKVNKPISSSFNWDTPSNKEEGGKDIAIGRDTSHDDVKDLLTLLPAPDDFIEDLINQLYPWSFEQVGASKSPEDGKPSHPNENSHNDVQKTSRRGTEREVPRLRIGETKRQQNAVDPILQPAGETSDDEPRELIRHLTKNTCDQVASRPPQDGTPLHTNENANKDVQKKTHRKRGREVRRCRAEQMLHASRGIFLPLSPDLGDDEGEGEVVEETTEATDLQEKSHTDSIAEPSICVPRSINLGIKVSSNALTFLPSSQSTTDLTEVEELTALQYQRKYEAGSSQYQRYDVGLERVTPTPGSGEYYGARQYVASIEIKFIAMTFALSSQFFPEVFRRDADPEDLARYVLLSLDYFRQIYGDGLNLRSLYYPSAVCTPLSVEKRSKVTRQITNIIDMLAKGGDV